MNRLRFWGVRYGRSLLFLAWLLSLVGLLPGGAYEAFLRPEFGVLLAVAGLALVGFLFVEMGRDPAQEGRGFSEFVRVLILAVPLAYLSIGREVALDSGDFEKRWTGPAGDSVVLPPEALAAVPADAGTKAQEASLVGLCWNSEAYEGKEVAVEGMLRHEPDVAARYGGNGWLLYRFVVACCAADAQPVAVMLTGGMATNWPGDAWARVTGRFTLRPDRPRPVPIMDVGAVDSIPKPRNPYLY
ncbi:MAG: TIGR03943 family protein [Opitutae bacterium]|nr:TIGR03943 family protein [Opitutae bacterium]